MNISELEQKLESANISTELYNLSGSGLRDQKFCLEETDMGWEVYYSERGLKFDRQLFSQESEACQELFDRLT